MVFKTCVRMSRRLFEGAEHANLYAKYRPHYGADIYERIAKFCRDTGNQFELAVDVGCGSGQSSRPLTRYFKKVIGIDVSSKQVENAVTDAHNISYRVGFAEDLPAVLAPETVDLVTIAQAIHWVDTSKFYPGVTKVLRPGGTLVAYGYGNCCVDNPQAQEILSRFYWDTLKGFWDEKREHINQHYKQFTLPFPGSFRDESQNIKKAWSVDQFVGYLSSWSGYQAYLAANPDYTTLEGIRTSFNELYDVGSEKEKKVHIEWPVFMLFGQKPKC